MKTIFCTYGDQKFAKSRVRLASEADNIGIFDECLVFTEDLKNDDIFRDQVLCPSFAEVSNADRGGGYWIWKPFLLGKVLASLAFGDIMVYADAGSSIPLGASAALMRFIDRIACSEKGVLGCRNPFIEKDWTKGDIFDYFNARNKPELTHSRQFSAGRMHIAKHCQHSLSLYREWWRIACDRPDLFSDSPSKTPNLPGFQENRHDASIWSLLCKTYGVVEEWEWDSIPIEPTRIRC